ALRHRHRPRECACWRRVVRSNARVPRAATCRRFSRRATARDRATVARSRASVLVEPAAVLGHFYEERCGREAQPELVLPTSELLHHLRGAERVRVAEGPAPEGRPAQAEDGADVAVAGGAEDAL